MRKIIIKSIAIFLSCFMGLDSLNLESFSHAQADLIPTTQLHIVPMTEISPDSLAFRGMKISKVFNGEGPIHWVLIRDIHCQAQAQERIATSLEQIARENLLDQVLVEGASGPVRTLLYEIFPNKDVRTQVARKFLRQGLLTGAEFSEIVMGLKNRTSLYGVEDPALYAENFKAFHLCRKYREGLRENISAMDGWIRNLKDQTYSNDLKRIDQFSQSLHSDTPKWQEWVKELEFISEQHLNLLAQTSDLQKFLAFFQETNSFDSKEAQKQLDQLIKDLQTRLSKEAFKEVVKTTLEYRLGHIKANEYLSKLKEYYDRFSTSSNSTPAYTSSKADLSAEVEKLPSREERLKETYEIPSTQKSLFQEKYPQLQTWLNISTEEKNLDLEVLWKELITFVQKVLYNQAKLEKVEDVVVFDEKWNIFKKLIHLELTRGELEATGLKGFEDAGSRAKTMHTLCQKYNVQDLNLEDSQISYRFDQCMKEAQRFYEFALKRDEVMAINAVNRVLEIGNRDLKERINKNNKQSTIHYPQITVLITGGFHTEGIQRFLEKKNISYIACTPEIHGELGFKRYDLVMKAQWDEINSEEFSKDRLLLRPSSDPIKKMLSPVSVMEREIHEQLKLDEGHVLKPLLKELINTLSKAKAKSVHQIVNRWFKKHADVLRSLDDKEGRTLIEVISRHKTCTLRWDRFNPNTKWAGRLIVAAMAKVFGENRGVVKFARWYFKKSENISEKRSIWKKLLWGPWWLSGKIFYVLVLPFIVVVSLVGAQVPINRALTFVLVGMAAKVVLTPIYEKFPKKVREIISFISKSYFILSFVSIFTVYLNFPFITTFLIAMGFFHFGLVRKGGSVLLKKLFREIEKFRESKNQNNVSEEMQVAFDSISPAVSSEMESQSSSETSALELSPSETSTTIERPEFELQLNFPEGEGIQVNSDLDEKDALLASLLMSFETNQDRARVRRAENLQLALNLARLIKMNRQSILGIPDSSSVMSVNIDGYEVELIFEDGTHQTKSLLDVVDAVASVYETLSGDVQEEAWKFLSNFWRFKLRVFPENIVQTVNLSWKFEKDIEDLNAEIQSLLNLDSLGDSLRRYDEMEKELGNINHDLAENALLMDSYGKQYEELLNEESTKEANQWTEHTRELHQSKKGRVLEKMRKRAVLRDTLQEKKREIEKNILDIQTKTPAIHEKREEIRQKGEAIQKLQALRNHSEQTKLVSLEERILRIMFEDKGPLQEKSSVSEKASSKTTALSFLSSIRQRFAFHVLKWVFSLWIVTSLWGSVPPMGLKPENVERTLDRIETVGHVLKGKGMQGYQTVARVPEKTLFWVPSFYLGFQEIRMTGSLASRRSFQQMNWALHAFQLISPAIDHSFRPHTLPVSNSSFRGGQQRESGTPLARLSRPGGFYMQSTYSRIDAGGAFTSETLPFQDAPLGLRTGRNNTVSMHFNTSRVQLFKNTHGRVVRESVRVEGRTEGFEISENSCGDVVLTMTGVLPFSAFPRTVTYRVQEHEGGRFIPSQDFVAYYTRLPSDEIPPPTLRQRLDEVRSLGIDQRRARIRQIMRDRFAYGVDAAASRDFGIPTGNWLGHAFEESSMQNGEKIKADCDVLAAYYVLLARYVGIPARLVRGAVDGNSNGTLDLSEAHTIAQDMDSNGGNGWQDVDATTIVSMGDTRLTRFGNDMRRQEEEVRRRTSGSTAGSSVTPEAQTPSEFLEYPDDIRNTLSLEAFCKRTDVGLSRKLEVVTRAIALYEPESVTVDLRVLQDVDSSIGQLSIEIPNGHSERQRLTDLRLRLTAMWMQKLADHRVISIGNADTYRRHLNQERVRWGLDPVVGSTAHPSSSIFNELTRGMTPEQRDVFLGKLYEYQQKVDRRQEIQRNGGSAPYVSRPSPLTVDYFEQKYAPLSRNFFYYLFSTSHAQGMNEIERQQELNSLDAVLDMAYVQGYNIFQPFVQMMLAHDARGQQALCPQLVCMMPLQFTEAWLRIFPNGEYLAREYRRIWQDWDRTGRRPTDDSIFQPFKHAFYAFDALFNDFIGAGHRFPQAYSDFWGQYVNFQPIEVPRIPGWLEGQGERLSYADRLRWAGRLQVFERSRQAFQRVRPFPANVSEMPQYFSEKYAPFTFNFPAGASVEQYARFDEHLTLLMRRSALIFQWLLSKPVSSELVMNLNPDLPVRFHYSALLDERWRQWCNLWPSLSMETEQAKREVFERDFASFMETGEVVGEERIVHSTTTQSSNPGISSVRWETVEQPRQQFFEQNVRSWIEGSPIAVSLEGNVEVDRGLVAEHPLSRANRERQTHDMLLSAAPVLRDTTRYIAFLERAQRLLLDLAVDQSEESFRDQVGHMTVLLHYARVIRIPDVLRETKNVLMAVIQEQRRRLGNTDWTKIMHFYTAFYDHDWENLRQSGVEEFPEIILPEIGKMLAEDILLFDPDFRHIEQDLQRGQDSPELRLLLKAFGLYHTARVDDERFREVSQRFLTFLQHHPNQVTMRRIWQANLSGTPGVSSEQAVGRIAISPEVAREAVREAQREFPLIDQGLGNVDRFSVEAVRGSGDLDRIRGLLQQNRTRNRQGLAVVRTRATDVPFSSVRMDEAYFRTAAGYVTDLVSELPSREQESIVSELLPEAQVAVGAGAVRTETQVYYSTLLGRMTGLQIPDSQKEQIRNTLITLFPHLSLDVKLEVFKAVQENTSAELKGFMMDQILADLELLSPDQIRQALERAGLLDFFSVNVILHWRDFMETRSQFIRKMIPIAFDVIPLFGLDSRARAGSTADLNYQNRIRQFDSFLRSMQTNWTEIVAGLVSMVESGVRVGVGSEGQNGQGASATSTPEEALARINFELLQHEEVVHVYEAILQSIERVIILGQGRLEADQGLSPQDRQRIQDETERRTNALLVPMTGFFTHASLVEPRLSPSDRASMPPVMYYQRMQARIQTQELRASEILRILQLASQVFTEDRWNASWEFIWQQRQRGWQPSQGYIHREDYQAPYPRLDFIDLYLMGFWLEMLPQDRRDQMENLYRQGRLRIVEETEPDYVQRVDNSMNIRRDFLLSLVTLRDNPYPYDHYTDENGTVRSVQDHQVWGVHLYERVVSELQLPRMGSGSVAEGPRPSLGQSGAAYVLSMRNRDAGIQTTVDTSSDAAVETPGVYHTTDPNYHFPMLRHDGNPMALSVQTPSDASVQASSPQRVPGNVPRRMMLPPALTIVFGLMAQTHRAPETLPVTTTSLNVNSAHPLLTLTEGETLEWPKKLFCDTSYNATVKFNGERWIVLPEDGGTKEGRQLSFLMSRALNGMDTELEGSDSDSKALGRAWAFVKKNSQCRILFRVSADLPVNSAYMEDEHGNPAIVFQRNFARQMLESWTESEEVVEQLLRERCLHEFRHAALAFVRKMKQTYKDILKYQFWWKFWNGFMNIFHSEKSEKIDEEVELIETDVMYHRVSVLKKPHRQAQIDHFFRSFKEQGASVLYRKSLGRGAAGFSSGTYFQWIQKLAQKRFIWDREIRSYVEKAMGVTGDDKFYRLMDVFTCAHLVVLIIYQSFLGGRHLPYFAFSLTLASALIAVMVMKIKYERENRSVGPTLKALAFAGADMVAPLLGQVVSKPELPFATDKGVKEVVTGVRAAGQDVDAGEVEELSGTVGSSEQAEFKHFSVVDGQLGGATVPDNRRVGQILKRELDEVALSFTETRFTGDVLSFQVVDARNHQENDLLKALSVFLNSSTLDKKNRELFESTRLVVLGGEDVAIERGKGGIIYAHYGKAKGNAPPTVYIRKKLLERLLQEKNWDALAILIQMEMYRKEHPDEDELTTDEVSKKLNVPSEKIDRLIDIVAQAEESRILDDEEIESEIMDMASQLDQISGGENSILGVKLSKLEDWVFERFIGRLAARLHKKEEAVIESLRRLREEAKMHARKIISELPVAREEDFVGSARFDNAA